MSDQTGIGANIKRLRGKLFTQRELADKAAVSVDLIRKLEQGQRHTARISNLHKIARALDVPLVRLLGKHSALPGSDGGVMAIRRTITPVDDLLDPNDLDDEPLSLAEAEREVDYLWGQYWTGKYEELGSLIPLTLPRVRATHRAVAANERARAAQALARVYQVAGDTLVHFGQQDGAFLAIREALTAANNGEDELLASAMCVSVAWQLLVQGRSAESEGVARRAAGQIEPGGTVHDSQLAVYGLLTVTAATAAARNQKRDSANELLDVAGEVAHRLGYERTDHQTTFGPAKVSMLAVDVHVVQDNFVEALSAAKSLPRDAALPLASRARHLADVALSHLRLGHRQRATDAIFAMESLAPEWSKYQSLPKQIVNELLEHERPSRLRELAGRMGAGVD
ncbi:hypothetical protein ALI144C_15190 [Actinosynnema sp. ALI-1.44]|uniref:helix-turn-helix domain-containing protein n=1 Tax=Actinosynnema sp. ALI-1.44 TaxID=1933779 RepID=UPI00097BB0AE|nr:helix-turn-helix transcriptional regulator [Actinosynnema sp. ALI-1.44]ONI84056.1 hypothetical protein ALI144C_15190 [Actinosynnema sp. ALI-1.44]